MPITIPEDDFEFAQAVDALGADGKSQSEIAAHFGLTRAQIRHRLERNFCRWESEPRVRFAPTGKRLDDAVESGEVAAAPREREPVPA